MSTVIHPCPLNPEAIKGGIRTGKRCAPLPAVMLDKSGIFIPADIKDCLVSALELCSSAIAQRSIGSAYTAPGKNHMSEFLAKGSQSLEGLKDPVRARLLRE